MRSRTTENTSRDAARADRSDPPGRTAVSLLPLHHADYLQVQGGAALDPCLTLPLIVIAGSLLGSTSETGHRGGPGHPKGKISNVDILCTVGKD